MRVRMLALLAWLILFPDCMLAQQPPTFSATGEPPQNPHTATTALVKSMMCQILKSDQITKQTFRWNTDPVWTCFLSLPSYTSVSVKLSLRSQLKSCHEAVTPGSQEQAGAANEGAVNRERRRNILDLKPRAISTQMCRDAPEIATEQVSKVLGPGKCRTNHSARRPQWSPCLMLQPIHKVSSLSDILKNERTRMHREFAGIWT